MDVVEAYRSVSASEELKEIERLRELLNAKKWVCVAKNVLRQKRTASRRDASKSVKIFKSKDIYCKVNVNVNVKITPNQDINPEPLRHYDPDDATEWIMLLINGRGYGDLCRGRHLVRPVRPYALGTHPFGMR